MAATAGMAGMAVMTRIRTLRNAALALALAGWLMPASAAAATIVMSPADDERGSDTLNLFASNTIGSADTAVPHGDAVNGMVEGADLAVLNPWPAVNLPSGHRFPLASNVAPLFIQGLNDGTVGYAGFVLRNATPGGGPVSIDAEDWGDTSVHPSLAIEFRAIPEPASLFLLGAGLMAVGLRLRRRGPRS